MFLIHFFGPYRASAPFALDKFGPQKAQQQCLFYNPWKFQLHIFSRLREHSRTKRPSKNHKIDDISRPEVTSSTKKISNKVQMNTYQIWKFRENRTSRFRELACTKSVGIIIIIIIIIGKKKQNENNKVFRWRRKTLIIRNRVKTICSQTLFGEHNNKKQSKTNMFPNYVWGT